MEVSLGYEAVLVWGIKVSSPGTVVGGCWVSLIKATQWDNEMTMAPTRSSVSKVDDGSKIVLENLEHVSQEEQLLSLFPVLQDKTPEELERLNKAVVRRLDWRFLPCVTMMLLMR